MTGARRQAISAILALAAALNCWPMTAAAQTKPKPAPQEPAKPAPEAPPAPYEADLLRLSEIMGALAFLRDLCNDNDGTEWHKQMAALLEAEGVTAIRRARLAGAYNKGFRGFELTYRACTPHAREVIDRYLEEGRTLARNTASRFGG